MDTVTQELTIIDKSLEVFKGGSAILKNHQERAMKALAVGGKLLQQWQQADSFEDEEARLSAYAELDAKSNDFLVKCGSASTQMQESRKAITQLMDMIKKMYTEEENKLDVKKPGIPADVQNRRNQYAKIRFEADEKKRKEAEAKAAKQRERIDMVASFTEYINKGLLKILSDKKTAITNSFNAITLEEFDKKETGLNKMSCDFPKEKYADIYVANFLAVRHTADELATIKNETITGYNLDAFSDNYKREISELKQSLIDRLPAKKQELEAIAEQARIAEENRLAAEAAAKKAAEAKSAAAKKAAEAEQERLAEEQERIAAEQTKLAEEKRIREAEEAARLLQEKEAAEKEAADAAERDKAAGMAATLFDQVAETSTDTAAPEVRSSYEIKVKHNAGWVEMFTFWFQKEGVTLSLDEMEKKTFKQIKTFCENAAKKDDVKIDSKYLAYETAIKSVNRKAK